MGHHANGRFMGEFGDLNNRFDRESLIMNQLCNQ